MHTEGDVDVSLSYHLVGKGWADCTIRVGDQAVSMTASYLSDALDDLSSAIVAALRGHPCPTASFCDEPGEYRWVLEPQHAGRVRVHIIEFPRTSSKATNEDGTTLLDAECSLRDLALALSSELKRIEIEMGAKGYKEMWINYEFPSRRREELDDLLSQLRPESDGA